MSQLSQYDLLQVLTFLKKLNIAVNISEFPSHLASILPLVIESDFTLLAATDPSLASGLEHHSHISDHKLLAAPLASNDFNSLAKVEISLPYFLQNPVAMNYLLTGDISAKKISDFLTIPELNQREALYGKYLQPLGMLDQMSIVVSDQKQFSQKHTDLDSALINNLIVNATPSSVYLEENLADLVIIIHRERRNFTDRDREILNLISSHILQTYQNSQIVSRMHQEHYKLCQVFNQTSSIIINPNGSVNYITTQSENLIRKYFPSSSFQNNDLPTEVKNWLQKSLMNLSIDSDFSKPIPSLRIIKEKGILMVRLSIDSVTDQYLLTLEEQTPLDLSLSALQELHLTKREAEILYWIIRDRTNQQISEILILSNRTVQKHCENIYSKLGVNNRAAAILKAIQKIGMFMS